MNQDNAITDVEFKEVPVAIPDPVSFLTQALRDVGYHSPEAWMEGLHPAAKTSPNIGERLFLVNRSLGLYLSEVRNMGDNIVPRMFISGATSYTNWTQIIKEGVCAWLMGQFDLKTGKRIAPPTVFTPGDECKETTAEDDSAIGLNLVSTEDAHRTVAYEQPILTDEQKFKLTIMAHTPGAVDEVTLSPTLKVRNVSRDGSSTFVFQDTTNSEEWFPLALESWVTAIPATWPIAEESKGITEIIPQALGTILEEVKQERGDDVTCTRPDADSVTQEAVYPLGMTPLIVKIDESGYIPDQVTEQKQSRLTTAILGAQSFTGEQPMLDMKFGGPIGFDPSSYQNIEIVQEQPKDPLFPVAE